MIEVDFKDRVPTYPGRVILTPVEGQKNTYTMTRADDATDPGTPLSKATFNSFLQSRLTGRFYSILPFTTLINSTSSTTNMLPSSGWTVSGLSAASGIYKITASSQISADYSVEKALDGKFDTAWGSSDGSDHYFTVIFPVAIIIKKISLGLGSTGATNGVLFKIQGSNNGTAWTELYSETFTSASYPNEDTPKEYTLTKTGDYSQYRLYFTKPDISRVYIKELLVKEWGANSYSIDFLANNMPGNWDIGQRITVQVPEYAAFVVGGNSFNGVKVNTTLLSGRKYELRYNGTTFDAKEL